jgi:hypothetical protein
MHQKFPQSSVVLRVFALILACFFSAVGAMAQEKATNIEPSVQPQPTATVGTAEAGKTILPVTDSAANKKMVGATDSKPLKTTTELPSTALTPVTKSNDSKTTSSTPVTKARPALFPQSLQAPPPAPPTPRAITKRISATSRLSTNVKS